MSCETHPYQPVEKCRAVYRCAACGQFAYKGSARTNVGSYLGLVPYKCHVTGCQQPVVVIYPVVKGKRRQQPSCQEHRKDKQ